MVRIAPIRLAYNPKTLWFDAGDLALSVEDAVIVQTARGTEFGHVYQSVFEASGEDLSALKSPLKPVLRQASDEDVARADDLFQMSRDALPLYKQIAAETIPEMNPISVEYLFDGDKAVFYFEAEDRVDFRELVRKLAAEFHVRVDMKQIGVRDEARMVGGYGHCGQELCCARLGGDFDPVSIRMAKEQDLSLNPQKISGVCGRLMCCLRYEFDAYKDFHTRAPKKGAKIQTPDGEAKVTDLDVPREIISLAVEGEKPVKVPLSDFEPAEDGKRPTEVGADAWQRAHEDKESVLFGSDSMLSSQLTAGDNLADPTRVRRVGGSKAADQGKDGKEGSRRSRRSRRKSGTSAAAQNEPAPIEHKTRRRRSTKVEADGSTTTNAAESAPQLEGEDKTQRVRRPRRRRSSAAGGAAAGAGANAGVTDGDQQRQPRQTQGRTRAQGPGRNSSNLRAAKQNAAQDGASAEAKAPGESSGTRRRRRRSHRSGNSGSGDAGANAGNNSNTQA